MFFVASGCWFHPFHLMTDLLIKVLPRLQHFSVLFRQLLKLWETHEFDARFTVLHFSMHVRSMWRFSGILKNGICAQILEYMHWNGCYFEKLCNLNVCTLGSHALDLLAPVSVLWESIHSWTEVSYIPMSTPNFSYDTSPSSPIMVHGSNKWPITFTLKCYIFPSHKTCIQMSPKVHVRRNIWQEAVW